MELVQQLRHGLDFPALAQETPLALNASECFAQLELRGSRLPLDRRCFFRIVLRNARTAQGEQRFARGFQQAGGLFVREMRKERAEQLRAQL